MSTQASAITGDALAGDATDLFAAVRPTRPVIWASELRAWVVTGHAEAVAVMRDADRFTVDDPRFTTAAVLGPSMLSLDGPAHRSHRSPFVAPFGRTAVAREHEDTVRSGARGLLRAFASNGRAELRTELAAPLATNTITRVLGIEAEPATVLDWYRHISEGIVALADDRPVSATARASAAELLELLVSSMLQADHRGGASMLTAIAEASELAPPELAPSAAIVLFGAIETSEGMTASALWHLLGHPSSWAQVAADRSLVEPAIEESLRLEPAAAILERFATIDVDLPVEPMLGDAHRVDIGAGDPILICLGAANRDPVVFPDPDRFDIHRPNAHRHLSFAQGPHACLGAHLARAETKAAIEAVLDLLPSVRLDRSQSSRPTGRVFRKPDRVVATWDVPADSAPPADQSAGASSRTSSR